MCGVSYPSAEAAYRALQFDGVSAYNDGLMIDILYLTLKQIPRLLDEITRRGGVPWLDRCRHFSIAQSAGPQSIVGADTRSCFSQHLQHAYQKALSGRGPATRVVHVRHAPFDIYIGRSVGSLLESTWHNPRRKGRDGSREEVVARFYEELPASLRGQVGSLQGKTLGCWCKSKAAPYTLCHGDVLAALADEGTWAPSAPAQLPLF